MKSRTGGRTSTGFLPCSSEMAPHTVSVCVCVCCVWCVCICVFLCLSVRCVCVRARVCMCVLCVCLCSLRVPGCCAVLCPALPFAYRKQARCVSANSARQLFHASWLCELAFGRVLGCDAHILKPTNSIVLRKIARIVHQRCIAKIGPGVAINDAAEYVSRLIGQRTKICPQMDWRASARVGPDQSKILIPVPIRRKHTG